jgi:hypothetical protein
MSWEPLHAMVNNFPDASAWGHADTEGEGNVTTPLLTDIKVARRTTERQRIPEAYLALKPRPATTQCTETTQRDKEVNEYMIRHRERQL